MYIDPATERHKIEGKIYYLVSFENPTNPVVCGFCDGRYIKDKHITRFIEKNFKLTETQPNFDPVKFAEDL